MSLNRETNPLCLCASLSCSCLLKSIKDSWGHQVHKNARREHPSSRLRTNAFEKAATVMYASNSSAVEVEAEGYLELNVEVASSACQAPGQ